MLTIAKTLLILDGWTQDAAGRAIDAPDAYGCVKAHQRAELLRGMADSVRRALAEGVAPFLVAPKAKAAPKAMPKMMDTLAFWATHGEAVQAIIAEYGLCWKFKAPFGDTELVQIPTKWRSCRGERGTMLHWSRDARVPAARFWPDGVLPHALEVRPDYARHHPAGFVDIDDDLEREAA